MSDVREIQERLTELGFYKGKIDGDYGPKTKEAVEAFQGANGLLVDGKVGPMTTAALWPEVKASYLSQQVLDQIFPGARQDIIAGILARPDKLEAAGLVTKMRLAHFLAQVGHESGGLRVIEENMNYSVEGLLKTFSRSRISQALAEALGRKGARQADQEAIANAVYGGPWGLKNLGNTQPGDGWRFRAGGLIQNTGRANFRRAGHEDDPEFLRSMPGALDAALVFWQMNDLNSYADRDDLVGLTKQVNGGTNGLAERTTILRRAKKALGV